MFVTIGETRFSLWPSYGSLIVVSNTQMETSGEGIQFLLHVLFERGKNIPVTILCQCIFDATHSLPVQRLADVLSLLSSRRRREVFLSLTSSSSPIKFLLLHYSNL